MRPDLIESASHMASSRADAIKTHHNDSEMVRQLRLHGRVVEPLKDFHKVSLFLVFQQQTAFTFSLLYSEQFTFYFK